MKYIVILIVLTTLSFSKNLDKVNLYLKWKHQFQFAGFYIAKEKGFFEEEGLDVNIIEPNSNNPINIDKILKEENSFGISDSSLINLIMHGEKLSLIMPVLQETPFAFLFLKSSNIKSVNDFENKRIMLDLNNKENAFAKLFLNKFNINEKNIKVIPSSYDIQDLINKKVDIFNAYISNEPYRLKEEGIEYEYLKTSSLGMNFYGDILFTSIKNEKNNPKRVKSFFNATMKGWQYAFTHIDETIKLILEKYNTQGFSYSKYLFEANSLKELSGINDGTFGKFNFTKINQIISSYFLIDKKLTLRDINNLHIDFLSNERFFIDDKSIVFNKEEIEYLEKKDKITFCVSKGIEPMVFYKNGEFKGITIDFFKMIEKKINKKIQGILTLTPEECDTLLKKKKVDLKPLILTDPNAYSFLKPTVPYYNGYLVLATKISQPYLLDVSQLEDKQLGLLKNTETINSLIKKRFPNLNFVEINGTVENALELIRKDEIYGFLGVSDIISYNIQKYFTHELKIMKRLSDLEDGSIGVVKDDYLLHSILNKAISSFSDNEKRDIKNKWAYVKEETIIRKEYLINIFFIIFIIILAFFYKQYILHKSNKQLKIKVNEEVEKNREKDKILFQQMKLASMGEMLNNIAHQWREPLNVINSNVAVIDSIFSKYKIEDKKLENTLIQIESQTKYMSDTIDSFRTFFYPSKEKKEFILSKTIEHVLRIIKFDYEKSNIQINTKILKDKKINGYKGEYIQTVIAILHNSKDAFILNGIKDRRIDICINNMLTIEDNAGGIDDKLIDRIFEPYFTTKYKNKGTGTGLYMAKMIIENSMNGTLSVEQKKDGTKFKIII
jgi:signal transduction histidine kinase/ABC-type nitrate/sulfonate/bicarbonate transport system substrate-binding protein